MVSSQRSPYFFTYFQENLCYNVFLVTMWIAYMSRGGETGFVSLVSHAGNMERYCGNAKKCKLPVAAYRKEGVFAMSINGRYQHATFCVVHCCYHVFYNTLFSTCKKPFVMWLSIKPLAHPWGRMGGVCRAAAPKPQSEIKKHTDFCRHDNIKHFTLFALQPKSATETGWLVRWDIEKCNKITSIQT
jgi:hypothetical protein